MKHGGSRAAWRLDKSPSLDAPQGGGKASTSTPPKPPPGPVLVEDALPGSGSGWSLSEQEMEYLSIYRLMYLMTSWDLDDGEESLWN